MWARRRSPGFPEPTLTVRLPRLSSWNEAQEGAARRIAARTGPSRPATPPTDARARTSVLASSSWSAPDRVHTDRDVASTTKTKADGRRRSGRPRRATSSPSPAAPVDGRGSMEGRGIISLRARHGTLVDHPVRGKGVRRKFMASIRKERGAWWRFDPVRLLLRAGLAVALVLAGLLTLASIDANWRFAHLEAAAPARVFSAPFVLSDGVAVVREDLLERLARLGYRKMDGHPGMPGESSVRFRAFEIFLNAFDYPTGRVEAMPVRVKVGFGRVGRIENLSVQEDFERALIEPEPLGTLSGSVREERLAVSIDDLPKHLLDAVVAVEDRRFYRHSGIDPRALARALFANVKSGEVVQGGSTITQQLAKNLYPSGERTLTRKLWETLAALSLEALHSKSEILERYLNQIYMAQRGPTSIIGVGAASGHYFGKDARYLDLPEAALVAGLIQSPGRYHPYRHPREALERRNLVLRLMRDEGFITGPQYDEAREAPLSLRPEPAADARQAPYFIDFVAQQLQDQGLRDPASRLGIRVFTTLDPLLQARADKAVDASLKQYERAYTQLRPLPGGEIQGAFVALNPSDASRQALALSLNVPTIRAAETIGLRDIVRMARRCGIESPLQPVPSIALGTFEVVPLEMVSAFTTIATLGTRAWPRAIIAVVDDSGKVMEVPTHPPQEAATPQASYLTLDLMRIGRASCRERV